MRTIILPVYNAYESLQRCLKSVVKWTDFSKTTLILIDDCSSDERVIPFLENVARKNSNVVLKKNATNRGFTSNINAGMDTCDDDVILLNSDTVVTEKWVEKLTDCAYSSPVIATVTPLSNNATVCSVPEFCKENVVPGEYTIDSYAKLVEAVSAREFPELPVGIGFCLYIKRSAIDCVGKFDAEAFANGYGEENDFCCRCVQAGFRNVMCDDTYVYHSGTMSYTSIEKLALTDKSEKVLSNRYPDLVYRRNRYIEENPNHHIQDRIKLAVVLDRFPNDRKGVLLVSHHDIHLDAQGIHGGIQTHVKDLIDELRYTYVMYLFARNGTQIRLTVYYDDSEAFFEYPISEDPVYHRSYDEKIESVFCEVLENFPIGIIHIHHVYHLSDRLFAIANEKSIPVYVTLHDHFYLCPNIKLYDWSGQICSDKYDESRCDSCLAARGFRFNKGYIHAWREKYTQLLQLCDCIFAPSQSVADLYIRYFEILPNRIKVIEHGYTFHRVPVRPTVVRAKTVTKKDVRWTLDTIFRNPNGMIQIEGWAFVEGHDSVETDTFLELSIDKGTFRFPVTKKRRDDLAYGEVRRLWAGFSARIPLIYVEMKEVRISPVVIEDGVNHVAAAEILSVDPPLAKKRMNIGFIGGHSVEKGSRVMVELFRLMKDDPVNFIVMGEIGDAQLYEFQQHNVLKTGVYEHFEVNQLLVDYEIDLICLLPQWEETFGYTLSEAVQTGVPVIVTDVGTFGERVRVGKWGWVVPIANAAQDTAQRLRALLRDRSELDSLRQRLSEERFNSAWDMANSYTIYYDKAGVGNGVSMMCLYDDLFPFYNPCLTDIEKSKFADVQQLQLDLESTRRELDDIHRARSYQVLVKLNRFISEVKNIRLIRPNRQ